MVRAARRSSTSAEKAARAPADAAARTACGKVVAVAAVRAGPHAVRTSARQRPCAVAAIALALLKDSVLRLDDTTLRSANSGPRSPAGPRPREASGGRPDVGRLLCAGRHTTTHAAADARSTGA